MMKSLRVVNAIVLVVSLMLCGTAAAQIPARGVVSPTIPSLTNSSEMLSIRNVSAQTGNVTFASAQNGGLAIPIEASASAESRAMKFVELYGGPFGLAATSQVVLQRRAEIDAMGHEHVRLQQVHQGVPVRAGEFIVHLDGSRVVAANGHILSDLPASVVPSISPADAVTAARRAMEKHRAGGAPSIEYSQPQLEIFNRGLLIDGLRAPSRLAWYIEADAPYMHELIWIDAQSRAVLLHFNQVAEAKSRQVYDSQHTSQRGVLVRSEGGGATGDADEDNAYTYAGITYDYYKNNHNRDSYDNAGATIISSAHYCAQGYPQGSTCPSYQNAAWTGTQMVYADGFASADDVVGHELTHAVTQYTAGLYYYMQSGALNESFSDIFGETIDLTDGVGNDSPSVRWKCGEDLSIGAIRDMMNPNNYSDPGKMSDSYFYCGNGDAGGVHENSGIPNHAFALMTDGGTYNNTTIAGIGLTKAAKIEYRALTVYLTSGSGFLDDYNALNQSCADLIGTIGITAGDCTQVGLALTAVEMNSTWPCVDAVQAPPQCSTGSPLNTFSDTFESATGNWTVTNDFGGWYPFSTNFAKSGTHEAYGEDPDGLSDHRMTMTNAVVVPANARLYFDHAFDFEHDSFDSYDGGVLEYTSNNGSTWTDASSMIDAGFGYNGAISIFYDNPLAGRSAFVESSWGYTGTRLNLASLAGKSVKFRFRIASDSSYGSLGWLIDNFAIYTCSNVPSGAFHVDDIYGDLGTVNPSTEKSAIIGGGPVLTDIARTSNGLMWGIDTTYLYSINPSTGAATVVGSLNAGGDGMNALVGNGTGLLAASVNSTSLYSVNTSTGLATALSGSLGFGSMGDLAFHAGSLYASVMDGEFSDLVRITLNGSSFTSVNLGHVTHDNLLFGLAEGTDYNLYGVSGTKVLRIDTTNPSASVVVVPNYAANGGLGDGNGAAAPIGTPFTDDVLTSQLTIIRAIHITELRTRINAIRQAKGLSAFAWTDPTLTVRSTKVRAVHVSELRTALSQAYTQAGQVAPSFTDPSLLGLKVKAIHIIELRAAVRAIE